MTIRSALRATIRNELDDNSGTPAFSDALLNEYINEAIRQYSKDLPAQLATTIVAVANQASYALPTGFFQALRVEQPTLTVRLPASPHRAAIFPGPLPFSDLIDWKAGVRTAPGWTYRVFANNLVLDPAPTATGATQDIKLDYLGTFPEPAADADTLTTPAYDDDILVALACARALQWIATDEAKVPARAGGSSPWARVNPTALPPQRYLDRAISLIKTRTDRLRSTSLEVL